jgi:cystathionine beta-synthase
VTESDLLGRLVEDRASLSSAVAEVMFRNVRTVHYDDEASQLFDRFSHDEVGLVVGENNELLGIITKMDLVESLTEAALT